MLEISFYVVLHDSMIKINEQLFPLMKVFLHEKVIVQIDGGHNKTNDLFVSLLFQVFLIYFMYLQNSFVYRFYVINIL